MLDDALKSANKEFGKNSVVRFGSAYAPAPVLPTGIFALDKALGGGIGQGRLTEIFGPEGASKTTLIYELIARTQQDGKTCAFIDVEHAFDPTYAAAVGVVLEDLLFSQPDSAEQALGIMDVLNRSGDVALVALDSVAMLCPQTELDNPIGKATMGILPRLMGNATRKLVPDAEKTGTALVFVNQVRMNISGYGNPVVQPGGRALKFAASQRIDLRATPVKGAGDEVLGLTITAKVIKNKIAKPFQRAEFDLDFGKGYSKSGSLFDAAVEAGLIAVVAGGWGTYGEERWQGRPAGKQYLEDNPSVAAELYAKLMEV